MDLFRRGLRARSQHTNFIGNHSKTTARFTCTSRFNRRIQCQQVGLIRHTTDHFNHVADLLRLLFQTQDHTRSIIQSQRHLFTGLTALFENRKA
ncbi:Uncharacterised protein [Vibrio cholerae]|nr:Uncharacterised protein [Vibrio cholerae]